MTQTQPPTPLEDRPAPVRRGTRTWRVVVVVGLVLVVAGVLLVVATAGAERQRVRDEAQASSQAQAAALALFTAIAEADAARAAPYLDLPPGDLVTDEVLAASLAAGPITDVSVPEPSAVDLASRTVQLVVEYTLAGEPVSQAYSVRDPDDDGAWTVDGAAVQTTVGALPEGLALAVNGVPVDGSTFVVLPGSYVLTTTTPHLALAGETSFVVTEPFYGRAPDVDPVLTDEGEQAFRTAVAEAAAACVAPTTLEAGCGLAIPAELGDGTLIAEDSLTRTLVDGAAEAIATMPVEITVGDAVVLTGQPVGQVDFQADCTKPDGEQGECTITGAPGIGAPRTTAGEEELIIEFDEWPGG